jgi:psp operon transcriptional activator
MALELEWPRWPGFSSRAQDRLQSYDWPGNVRELRNVVERAVYRWEEPDQPVDTIQFDPFESPWRPRGTMAPRAPALEATGDGGAERPALPPSLMPPPGQGAGYDPASCADFRLAVAEYEKAILAAALERCRWNQRAAASALSLSYDQLRHALKRHQLMA